MLHHYIGIAICIVLLVAEFGCAVNPPAPPDKLNPHQAALIEQGLQTFASGEYEPALDRFEAAVAVAETDAQTDAAKALLAAHRGKLGSLRGQFQHALTAYDQALALLARLGDREASAKTLTSIANLYSYLGDYASAQTRFRQALAITERNDLKREQARALAGLGAIELRRRDYTDALDKVTTALSIVENLDDTELAAETHIILGVLYREQGDYPTALEHYQTALGLNLASGRDAAAHNARINIGELHLANGDPAGAATVLQQALNQDSVADNPLWLAVTRAYLGDVALLQADFITAMQRYREVLPAFQQMGIRDRIARAWLKLGIAAAGLGEPGNALDFLDQAIALYRDLGDRKWLAEALYRQGVSLQALGQLPAAERAYREAVDVYEQVRATVPDLGELRHQFNEQHAVLYENLIDLLVRSGRIEEALHYVNRSRTRALREMFERGGFSAADSQLRALIEQYSQLAGQETVLLERLAGNMQAATEQTEGLNDTLQITRQTLNKVIGDIRGRDDELYRLLAVRPTDLAALANSGRMPPDVLLLVYFPTDTRLYLFFVGAQELGVRFVPVAKTDLYDLVRDTRRLIVTTRQLDPGDWRVEYATGTRRYIKLLREHLIELYRYLLAPLEPKLADYKLLAVAPFGALHYVPFPALAKPTPDRGLRFALQDHGIVSVLPTTFARWLERQNRDSIAAITAFGNPELGDPGMRLPGAEREVDAIRRFFPQADVYLGSAASKDNFIANWGYSTLIHVAAHGELDPQRGPYLLLAPQENGRLTLRDITALPPRHQQPVVTLSACRTALAAATASPPGSELDSLAYGFSRAGASGVIATLWAVNDETTARLMSDVYQRAKTGNRISYAQLRAAQLAALNWPGAQRQPYYWAPFVYYGQWSP